MRFRAAVIGALVLVAAFTTACQMPSGATGVGHNSLIDTMAAQVEDSDSRDYTAQYRIDGKTTASLLHAVDPPRTGYLFAKGRQVVSDESIMTCTGSAQSTCTVAATEGTVPPPDSTVLDSLGGNGFLTARTVTGWLAEAGADPGAIIDSESKTIAGEHTTCVTVSQTAVPGVSALFGACITDSGLLGSFDGVVGGGDKISILLTSYDHRVDEEQLVIPKEGKDTRPEQV